MPVNFEKFLQKLQCQFLCCYPVDAIEWQNIPNDLTWDQQKQIVECTLNNKLNKLYPINMSYQISFIKKLLFTLENNETEEVHDIVYVLFCQLQENFQKYLTEEYAYKHYVVHMNEVAEFPQHITLRESKSFVKEGTTGLCSWQAALALADYLLHHIDIVNNKNILEFGAGTGVCGMLINLLNQPKQTILTDGSDKCIELMQENIARNFINAQKIDTNHFKLNDEKVLQIKLLEWNAIESSNILDAIKPNILIASDVVYDDTIFDDLLKAIVYIFNGMENCLEMFLAATIRNESTLAKFLKLLDNEHFIVEERNVIAEEDSYLYWQRKTPVKIFAIKRLNN